MTVEVMIGRGRDAIDMVVDPGSFHENQVGDVTFPDDIGPGAVVGEAAIDGRDVVVIANDAQAFNDKFPVVYFGVIGLEEAYKMAKVVYTTIKQDADKPVGEKRPLVLIVDTPGNGPGKIEEIFGMNKATGSYQLALAEARKSGHPVIALVIGRAISGAFLCHGLQADHILSLSPEFGTMIHVMPITSISRITKMDIERLEELSKENPVFAATWAAWTSWWRTSRTCARQWSATSRRLRPRSWPAMATLPVLWATAPSARSAAAA